MAKVRTNVKPIHRKPVVHVPMGYTPAEERAMQERKVALIEQQEALLKGSNEYLRLIEHDIREQVDAIKALSNVLQVLVTQAVPAKRGRPAKEKPPEGPQEPAGTTPAVEPSPAFSVVEDAQAKAAQDFAAKQAKLPAPEGLVHASVKTPAALPPPPTLDELRTAFLDFIAKNGRDAGISKLQAFGVGKLGELPATQYAVFKSNLG